MGRRITCRLTWVVLATTVSLAGCTSPSAPSARGDADAIYVWRGTRGELEDRYGPGKLVWVREQVPADAFAAAALREIVSLGKPRPTTYEVFTRRSPDGGNRYQDYVFFDSTQHVVYIARRPLN
jgi:hypothetical protein